MIDRLRYAIRELVLAAHPSGVTALWAPSEFPRSPSSGGSVITAKIVRGPSLRQSQRVARDLPTSLLWTVAPVTGTRIGLRLSSVQRHVDIATTDAETARDAFLAELNTAAVGEALLPGVTAAAIGVDSIRLTGAIGTMYDIAAMGEGVTVAAEASTYCLMTTGRAQAVIELQAYAASRAPVALELLAEVAVALRGDDVDAIEAITGVTFARHAAGDIVDLTTLAGPVWESRAAVRLAVDLRTTRATAIESIETLSVDRLRTSRPGGADAGPPAFEVETP